MQKKDQPGYQPAFIMDFLKSTLPFGELDDDVLAALSEECLIDFLPAGSLVAGRGNTLDSLYVVQKGGVKLYSLDEGGNEVLCDFRGEGNSVGGMSVYACAPSEVNIETVEDTFFIRIARDIFLKLVEKYPFVSNFYLKTPDERQTEMVFEALRRRKTENGDSIGLYLFGISVSDLVRRKPLGIERGVSLRRAAALMVEHNSGSLLVREIGGGEAIGIVTDKDLRKAVALGLNHSAPIETVMSAPVRTIDGASPCFEALLAMMAGNIHHLGVISRGGIIGVVSAHDILAVQGKSPLTLLKRIKEAAGFEELPSLAEMALSVAATLIDEGAKAGNLYSLVTILGDMLLRRIGDLIAGELGASPGGFSVIVFDQAARGERPVGAPLAHGIVLEDVQDEIIVRAREIYLDAFCRRFAERAAACGFGADAGGVSVAAPMWRKTPNIWEEFFTGFGANGGYSEDTPLMDFRCVWGREESVSELRTKIFSPGVIDREYWKACAKKFLEIKAPLSFFKNFLVEKDGEHKNKLNLYSRAILPFTRFARICALKTGVGEPGTLDRLKAAEKHGLLPASTMRDVRNIFEFLLQLRMVQHVRAREEGYANGDHVDPSTLGEIERKNLKDSFDLIGELQTLLRGWLKKANP